MKITIKQIEAAGYEITSYGVILGKSGRPMKQRVLNSGYDIVSLRIDGTTVQKLTHRVIAAKWLTKPAGCDVVNHKDGDKLNNHPDNLEWTTQSANLLHAHGADAYNSSDSNVAHAKRLRAEGLTLKQIAYTLGTSYVSVWRWLKL